MEPLQAKKRQCVLCDEGRVVTSSPKDKAVCHDCAILLMDGECTHTIEHLCDCPCHLPGSDVLHVMPCCITVSCEHCGKKISSSQLQDHIHTYHKTLSAFLEP